MEIKTITDFTARDPNGYVHYTQAANVAHRSGNGGKKPGPGSGGGVVGCLTVMVGVLMRTVLLPILSF